MERFFSKKERQKLFLSWAGSASMWIKVSHPYPHSSCMLHRSLPNFQGGAAIWGNDHGAPDDPLDATLTHGQFVSFRTGENVSALGAVEDDGRLVNRTSTPSGPKSLLAYVGLAGAAKSTGPRAGDVDEAMRNMTADEAGDWILTRTPTAFQKMMASNYSVGFERDEEALKRNDGDPTKWSNPLEVR